MVAVDAFKRQVGIDGTTAAGISDSAVVVDPDAATSATEFVFDTSATSAVTFTPPPLVAGSSSTPIVTTGVPSTNVPAPTTSDSLPEPAAASGQSISISTVVGSCVGAFVGAALFIAIGLFFYKRYSQSLKDKSRKRALPRSPFTDNRGPGEGRGSKTWNRLNSGEFEEDKWEGMDKAVPAPISIPPRKQPDNLTVAPLEKMNVFKKSPSTISHRGSDENEATFEMHNHPYGQIDPPKMPEARDLLGREPQNMLGQIDSGPPISWASSPSQASFLNATRLEGGAMSPTLAMAIPTPPATRSQLHRWESAEVINLPEGQSADIMDEKGSRTSLHNPFFSGGNTYVAPKRTRSTSQSTVRSSRSRSNSNATVTQQPASNTTKLPVPEIVSPVASDKGKERHVSMDPFTDPLPLPPSFIRHQTTGSASSAASNERAIRQLVAAAGIDLNEDEVQRRLKAVSMQPSIISDSGDSMYTDADPDLPEEALSSFPKPPSSTSSHGTIRK